MVLQATVASDQSLAGRAEANSLESWVIRKAGWFALAMTAAAFALRVYYAISCYLNPQEAHHFLAARTPQTLHGAYEAMRSLDIPSLSVLALHWVTLFGRTELVLRMPGLLSASLALWFAFAWMRRILGELPALGGLLFLAVSQSAITAAAQIEQFGLLVLFVCAALYATERAFDQASSRWAIVQGLLLACALLTHYVAILVVVALGLYVLIRCRVGRAPRELRITFLAIQAGLALEAAFLYFHFVRHSRTLANMSSSFYHRGAESLFDYWWMSMCRTFTFLIGFGNTWSHKIAILMFCIFAAGVAALLVGRVKEGRINALLIVSPFVIGFAGALLRLAPFAGTRLQAYLLPFFAAGLGAALKWVPRGRAVFVLLLATVCATVWAATNKVDHVSHASDIDPRVFPISDMSAALDYISQSVPPGAPLFVDEETRDELSYYLGRNDRSLSGFDRNIGHDEVLKGHRIISSSGGSWSFDLDHPLAQASKAAEEQGVPARTPIWIVSVLWPYQEPLSVHIPAESIRNGRTFGAISVMQTELE